MGNHPELQPGDPKEQSQGWGCHRSSSKYCSQAQGRAADAGICSLWICSVIQITPTPSRQRFEKPSRGVYCRNQPPWLLTATIAEGCRIHQSPGSPRTASPSCWDGSRALGKLQRDLQGKSVCWELPGESTDGKGEMGEVRSGHFCAQLCSEVPLSPWEGFSSEIPPLLCQGSPCRAGSARLGCQGCLQSPGSAAG